MQNLYRHLLLIVAVCYLYAAFAESYAQSLCNQLVLKQKMPNIAEKVAVGETVATHHPSSPSLVRNDNPNIIFKNEENVDVDRLMTPRLKEKLDRLSELVMNEWPDRKLRVTEAYDPNAEHTGFSTHYEGRAADIMVSIPTIEQNQLKGIPDPAKLGRLACLAVDAGFDWVWYEDIKHIHASVKWRQP